VVEVVDLLEIHLDILGQPRGGDAPAQLLGLVLPRDQRVLRAVRRDRGA
jgi:hypothetical protein